MGPRFQPSSHASLLQILSTLAQLAPWSPEPLHSFGRRGSCRKRCTDKEWWERQHETNTPLGWRTQVTKCSATVWFMCLKQKGTQPEHCCGTAWEAFSALEGFCLHIPAKHMLWITHKQLVYQHFPTSGKLPLHASSFCFSHLWGERKKCNKKCMLQAKVSSLGRRSPEHRGENWLQEGSHTLESITPLREDNSSPTEPKYSKSVGNHQWALEILTISPYNN